MMNARGFTLMELLIVIAVIAILAAFAVPQFAAWRENARYNDAAYQVAGILRETRMKAVSENLVHTVQVNPSARTVAVVVNSAQISSVTFPSVISLRTGTGTGDDCTGNVNFQLDLNVNGTSAVGGAIVDSKICIYDSGGERRYAVEIYGTTGRVTVSR